MAQQQRAQVENRSRFMLKSPAIRPGMHGRILLGGPSGAGKTYTSLLIASVLAGTDRTTNSIVMIDTEKGSGKTYADEFMLADGSPGYSHIPWEAPFNATDLAMTLRDASNDPECRVVIVDSHSHFWRGEGGVLDVSSGRWTGWKEARPMHADMIDAILSCDAHVILCARMVQEHVQVKDEKTGKLEVRKLGMKVQQDDNLEYEVNIGIEMDMSHVIHVSKSRTRAVPVGAEFISGHAEEFAGIYRDWLAGGEPAASREQTDGLIAVLNRIEDPANRQRAKLDFVNTFGRPEMLLVSRLPDANAWVADRLLGMIEPSERAEGDVPPDDGGHEEAPEVAPAAVGVPSRTGEPTAATGDPTAPETPTAPDTAPDGAEALPVAPDGPDEALDGEVGSEALRRARCEVEVEAMSVRDVHDALVAFGRSPNGSVKDQRKRLVDQYLKTPVGTPI